MVENGEPYVGRRKLVRDAEARRDAALLAKEKEKEEKREEAKKTAKSRTSQEKIDDERSIKKMLEHVTGSRLQEKRLKKEAIKKRLKKKENASGFNRRISENREKRQKPLNEYDECQKRIQQEEQRAGQETEKIVAQKARQEELERARLEDEQKIDALRTYFSDGVPMLYDEDNPDAIIADETDIDNGSGIANENDEVPDEYENLPQQVGIHKMAQMRDGWTGKVRAQKWSKKAEGSQGKSTKKAGIRTYMARIHQKYDKIDKR